MIIAGSPAAVTTGPESLSRLGFAPSSPMRHCDEALHCLHKIVTPAKAGVQAFAFHSPFVP